MSDRLTVLQNQLANLEEKNSQLEAALLQSQENSKNLLKNLGNFEEVSPFIDYPI